MSTRTCRFPRLRKSGARKGDFPPKAGVAIEGPFGEMGGYYGDASPASLIKIHAFLYRDNPIIMGSPPFPNTARICSVLGACVCEQNSKLWEFLVSKASATAAESWFSRSSNLFPGMRCGPRSVPSAARAVPHALCILVDEDVEPHNLGEVFEAMGSRYVPGRR